MRYQALYQSLVVVFVIVAWYGSNIGVLLLNKYLLTGTDFKSPVFLTFCHMVACVILGLGVSLTGFIPAKPIKSQGQLVKISVLSAIFCFTIVLGNASLRYIPVSFNQAIGATTPFFTAIFAFFLEKKRESKWTYAALIPVAAGVVVASGGEPLFHALGFTLCLLATGLRALKSVIQSLIMTDPSEKMDAMSLLLYMSGISCILLLPMTMLLEPEAFRQAYAIYASDPSFLRSLVGNSILAYFVNLTNFLVTKLCGALTLQVLGNAKGVVAAVISVLIFGNPVTMMGAFGYGITVMGVVLYSESKRRSAAVRDPLKEEPSEQLEPLTLSKGSFSAASPANASPNITADTTFRNFTKGHGLHV